MAEPGEKVELAARLESARARLGRNVEALRHDLDVGNHLRHSFHENKAAYIGGATVLGLILSKLPVRRKKVYVDLKGQGKGGAVKKAEKAGILILLLQFLFKTFQPMLTSLISRQVTDFVKRQGRSGD